MTLRTWFRDNRVDGSSGPLDYLLWRAFHREGSERSEPPSPAGYQGRHTDTADCCGGPGCDATGPHPDPAPAAVQLPAVRDEDPEHGQTGDMPTADRQPIPEDCPQQTAPDTVEHVGADEGWSPKAAVMVAGQSWELLTLAEIAEQTKAEFAALVEPLLTDFQRRWDDAGLPTQVEAVHDFTEAMALATGEYELVGAA